ncbi:unnamed protein product [marine sediment metagenome]|uniref:HEPN domain-containing protein n=1 Tax=marine sediment metagenome TaxID=412755 RepID=X1LHP6_9ZZZZ
MKQEFKDLAKYRLERARDTLLDAQKYFKDATLKFVKRIEEITLGIL